MNKFDWSLQNIIDKLWEIRTGAENIIPDKLNIDEIIINEKLTVETLGENNVKFEDESHETMKTYSNGYAGFEELNKSNVGKTVKIELSVENYLKNLFPVGQINKLLNPLNVSKIHYPAQRHANTYDKLKFKDEHGDDVDFSIKGYIIRHCYKCDYKWWRKQGLTYCDYPIVYHSVSLDENQGINRYSTDYCYYQPGTSLEFFTDAIAMDGKPLKKITWVNEHTHIMHQIHANDIKRALSEQLQWQEYWHVLIYPRDGLKIEMTVDNNQIKYLFKNRELNQGEQRKDALLNFVKAHERKLNNNEEKYIEVKKHLRGCYKFDCFGYHFDIIPSDRAMYEQKENHRQSEKTIELLELLDSI